mgnify:CR=1 FL=1
MALTDHFIHRCTIQRATMTLDEYNNAKPAWANVATAVACRLVEKEERRFTNERAEDAISTKYKLMLAANADVLERDRVIVEGRTFTVEALLRRNARAAHHVTALLSVVV